MNRIRKFLALYKEYGLKTSVGLALGKVKNSRFVQKKKAAELIKKSMSDELLTAERQNKLNTNMRLSILTPVYNTDEGMLKCVIESVLNQTYPDVELCIADASDDAHSYVGDVCMDYARRDNRVKYHKLDENMGIADNTNRCMELATGEYIGLLDHDDILHPSAAYKVIKAFAKQEAEFVYTDEACFEGEYTNILSTNLKPDYSPYTLRCNNYICHFTAFTRELYDRVGGFRNRYDGSQDHDLFLRLTDAAKKVCHIPEILYFWRAHKGSVVADINAKSYAVDAGISAVNDFLASKDINADVSSSEVYPTIYRIKYELKDTPLVSIIILNHEHAEDLKRCITSIRKSTYKNYEIIIVENNSESKDIHEYYEELKDTGNVRIIERNKDFNYSEFNNAAVKEAAGEYIVLLNNDTEVINPEWMEEMLMYAVRDDVGAVGARLFYPDGRLQHCFVITGIGEDRVAVHAGLGLAADDYGYLDRIGFVQNVNAVTAACLMVSKAVYEQVGGLDEKLTVAYNDVDFCLALRKAGYYNVYTPYATMYHYESASRGSDWSKANRDRLVKEAEYIKIKWKNGLTDPYYNPNFSLDKAYMLR